MENERIKTALGLIIDLIAYSPSTTIDPFKELKIKKVRDYINQP